MGVPIRAYRWRGLARLLVRRCLATARPAGEPAVALRVDNDNAGAWAPYDGLGFRRWRADGGLPA